MIVIKYVTAQEYFKDRRSLTSLLIALACIGLCLYQIYTGIFGAYEATIQRSIHLAFGLVIVFLSLPTKSKWPWFDKVFNYSLALLSIVACGYLTYRWDWVTFQRYTFITPLTTEEIILGTLCILFVLEATRRVAGNSLLVVVLVFFAYAYLAPYLPGIFYASATNWHRLIDFLYLGTEGIFGIPLGVSTRDIALFIIFGAILMKSGGSDLINNLSISMTGNSKGGPAKVAILASAFISMFSGSGTANVATTGSATIPMMKKAGYKAEFAGAVEAVASTGGQIMPPVMGAAAFILASFSGIPYIQVMRYALIPAILYFLALYMAVHLEAMKNDLKPIKPEVTVKDTLLKYGHMFFPLVCLILVLILGYTPRMAGGAAVVTALVASELRRDTRMGFWGILNAFEFGAKAMTIVIMSTASAGMIIGIIRMTALGQAIGASFVRLAGGELVPALILGMLLALLLGLGMPTATAYIIQASTTIPALIAIGVPNYVAHLFCLYFACLSLITPPVAITSYAASSIAGSDMWKTSIKAFSLGIPAYIVPFMFVYGEGLLLVGPPLTVIFTVATAVVGVGLLAAVISGYLYKNLNIAERAILFFVSLLFISPSVRGMLLGLAILLGLFFLNFKVYRALWSKHGQGKEESA